MWSCNRGNTKFAQNYMDVDEVHIKQQNGLSITTVFQEIFFILYQVRTTPITLLSQMFCPVLWPCKYWHSPKRYKKQPVYSYSNLELRYLHLVQHDNVSPEQTCLILRNTSQVYNSIRGISCHYGGRFAEPTKITWYKPLQLLLWEFSTNSDRDTVQQFCKPVTVKCKNQCAQNKCCTTKKFPTHKFV